MASCGGVAANHSSGTDLSQRLPVTTSDPVLDDRGPRLVGIPFFALVITHFSGVLGPYGPGSMLYWLGCGWFILLSALLWHANRNFLQWLRHRYDWLDHPWRKVLLLLGANVFSTVPLTGLWHVIWYRFAGLEMDARRVLGTTLAIVASVIFVTHVYETVYLIRQRERDLLAAERLERARTEAELAALKSHVDPHFLFNCLNSLAYLIPQDAPRAALFAQRLGEVYLYILSNRERDLVPLAEELRFAEGYMGLLHLRFGDAFRLVREGTIDPATLLIPPVSLQVLLENAVKHNTARTEEPLEIHLTLGDDRIVVSNALRTPGVAAPSPGTGLANLNARYERSVGRGVEVSADDTTFAVVLPLLAAS